MLDFNTFQREIRLLVRDKQFKEALTFFKTNKALFKKAEIANNPYLVADMLSALRGTQAFEAASKFLEIYSIALDENLHDRIVTSYALVLYDFIKSHIANENKKHKPIPTNDQFWDQVLIILSLLSENTDEIANNIYDLLSQRIIACLSKIEEPNYLFINRICEHIDSEKLSINSYEFESKEGGKTKKTALASTKESWYALYSKALYETKNYKRCIEICKEALDKIEKMHYSNDIWISRRMANSLHHLGGSAEALAIFQSILLKKRDWFLVAEYAELLYALNQKAQALISMQEAMLLAGPINFKIELIERIGDLYAENSRDELAKQHYQLALSIRVKEGWRVNLKLLDKAQLVLEQDEAEIKFKALRADLQKTWQLAVPEENQRKPKSFKSRQPEIQGVITRVGFPKEAGVDLWLSAESGEKLYAFVQRTDEIFNVLKKDLQVSFTIKSDAKGKLNRAVRIKLSK